MIEELWKIDEIKYGRFLNDFYENALKVFFLND